MTISIFVEILLECCAATYHLEAEKEPCEYIVWREVGTRGLRSDNQRTEEAQRIAVDLFTKKEFSEIPDKIRKAFNKHDIAYSGPEIISEPEMPFRVFAYTVELD